MTGTIANPPRSGSVMGGLVGASVKRVEDPRFLTGRGRYVDDIKLPRLTHAAFLRSPHAHARITRLDTTAAKALPGVVAVLTAADLVGRLNPVVVQGQTEDLKDTPPFPALAAEKVRYVGDLVAMVIAESRALAEDAVDLIEADYDPLPPVPNMAVALDPSSAPLFDELGTNHTYHHVFDYGDVDAAFAGADRIVRRTYEQQRYMNVPMETRGGIAEYRDGELTYHASTQSPHMTRFVLSGELNIPQHRIRVVAPDIGGAFGLKFGAYREDMLTAAAAMIVGRPVKWIEDRRENLTAGGHAREETLEVEAAVMNDGRIAALKVKMTLDAGAYPVAPIPAAIFSAIVRVLLPGPYRIPAYRFDANAVVTNKASYVSYRGPWAVETWVRELLVDAIARELGMAPEQLRLDNIVSLDEQPYTMSTGVTLRDVTPRETLVRALELADVPAFRDEQRRARESGRLLGFGMATFIEPAPGGPDFGAALGQFGGMKEVSKVRVDPSGSVTVITPQSPHGQGHETTLAQVAAEEFGVPFESVRVIHGDTSFSPFSFIGTGGSRAATNASNSVIEATRDVKGQVLDIVSAMFEAAPGDLQIVDGIVSVKGVPQKAIPLAQVAMMVYLAPGMLPPGAPAELLGSSAYEGEGGYPSATHCCWVEVDPGTGKVDITRYLVVEDVGEMINPAIVEGQIRGGVAQGIGGALLEHAIYGEDGQFQTASFMDYLVPTAMEVPEIEIEHLSIPRAVRFLGVGEGGAICAPPAVTNAIADAIGTDVTRTPATPSRVLELLGTIPVE